MTNIHCICYISFGTEVLVTVLTGKQTIFGSTQWIRPEVRARNKALDWTKLSLMLGLLDGMLDEDHGWKFDGNVTGSSPSIARLVFRFGVSLPCKQIVQLQYPKDTKAACISQYHPGSRIQYTVLVNPKICKDCKDVSVPP